MCFYFIQHKKAYNKWKKNNFIYIIKIMKKNTEIKALEKEMLKYRSDIMKNQESKLVEDVVSKLYQYVSSMDKDNDEWTIDDDYKKMLYAIKSLHVYLYNGKNSNLNADDAKIFVSYLLWKIQWLKNILDKFDDNKI